MQLREEKAVSIGDGAVFPAVLSRVSTSEPFSFCQMGHLEGQTREQWAERKRNVFSLYKSDLQRPEPNSS